jgi:DNA primase
MYGRSVAPTSKNTHYYTTNRAGLYPKYPSREARQLIITESIIDAATLLSITEIKSNYEILALYGTNGLTAEIKTAITVLESLEEIILFFDGDEAGRKATASHGTTLKELLPNYSYRGGMEELIPLATLLHVQVH